MAIKVYERMPANSPLKRNEQIQLATNLDAADRSDEAIKILKEVTTEDSKDIEAIMALGNIERGRKKFADCVTTYSRAIDVMPASGDKNSWVTYYYRGICEERSKQWSKAEADMRQALDMQPEPEELPKIEAKIENGLPEDTSSAASADKKKEDGKGG